jgi:hypothetical protein
MKGSVTKDGGLEGQLVTNSDESVTLSSKSCKSRPFPFLVSSTSGGNVKLLLLLVLLLLFVAAFKTCVGIVTERKLQLFAAKIQKVNPVIAKVTKINPPTRAHVSVDLSRDCCGSIVAAAASAVCEPGDDVP